MAERRWGLIAAGLGTAAMVGAGVYYLFERSSEQPPFMPLERDGAFELRDYPELLVAETVDTGARQQALDRGFDKLAGYIFAKSRGGERISMTAPVLSDRDERIAMTAPVLSEGAADGWRTRFVMPAKYSRDTLPPPGPGVTITTRPARRVAVLRFAGKTDDATLAEREAELRRWMTSRGLSAGAFEYAFYNSPFIPGPLRRNEVMIEVSA